MNGSKKQSWWQTIPGMLTALAGIITAISGLVAVLYQNDVIHKKNAQTNPPETTCSISGLVFDSENSKPLPAVSIDLYRDMSGVGEKPTRLKLGVATAGPDGKFSSDCSFVKASEYPVRIGVSSPDWVATRITTTKIEHAGEWSGLNIAIPMSTVDLKPLKEIGVSFGGKHVGSDWFLYGNIENKSSVLFPCIRAKFRMTASNNEGEAGQDLGEFVVEVRSLGPNEKRPYEQKLPGQVGVRFEEKEVCQ